MYWPHALQRHRPLRRPGCPGRCRRSEPRPPPRLRPHLSPYSFLAGTSRCTPPCLAIKPMSQYQSRVVSSFSWKCSLLNLDRQRSCHVARFECKQAPCPSLDDQRCGTPLAGLKLNDPVGRRSEEHTSELQSLMRISYAVFCLKKKKSSK